MNLVDQLRVHAESAPERPAIIVGDRRHDRTLSFGALDDRAARLAGLLLRSGLRPGDRVVVLAPIGIELYVCLFALLRAGLTAVIFDPATRPAVIDALLARIGAAGIVATRTAMLYAMLRLRAARIIARKFVFGRDLPNTFTEAAWRPLRPAPISTAIDDATPALLTLTSGSTGLPKIAVRTHGFLAAQYLALTDSFPQHPAQVELVTLPMFALVNLVAGTTSVLPPPGCRTPAARAAVIPRLIERHGVTRLVAAPALAAAVFEECRARKSRMHGVREMLVGGGPVFSDLIEASRACLPDGFLHVVYGATEAEPIAHIDARRISADDLAAMRAGRGLLVGRAIPAIVCQVIRGQTAPAASDPAAWQRGEIVVRGDHVLPRYEDDEITRQYRIDIDGASWHRTGDAGYFDADGRLWLLGRVSAGSHNVMPFEVEAPARACAGVRHAGFAVVNGKRCLAVQPRGWLTPLARRQLRGELARLPVDEIRLLRRLPLDRRHQSKVDYPALRRCFGGASRLLAGR